ncbi:hypothetical protein [Nocardia sp. NPDC057455]|uniref:hypothetical protein n=1 Tax=Nocardia sp. NPDC057455 TaxID=3346138 RepID=UPI00366D511F
MRVVILFGTEMGTAESAADSIAEELVARGAVQLGEHARHDASTEIRVRDMARQWADALDVPALLSA